MAELDMEKLHIDTGKSYLELAKMIIGGLYYKTQITGQTQTVILCCK